MKTRVQPVKAAITFAGLAILAMGLAAGRCAGEDLPDAGTRMKSFAMEKEQQAQSLADSIDVDLPPEVLPFFSAIRDGSWESASNHYSKIKDLVFNSRNLHRNWWQPVVETYGAEEQLSGGGEKYFTAYAEAIISSIPPGSIYFGGTDPGRFIITAMEKSQINGDPFFTLTQNELADETYLDYVSAMYGDQIHLPTQRDSQKCFNDYIADAERRRQLGQLQAGETITVDPYTGKKQASGQVAVMGINALIVKLIFDENPGREFYIQESFPLAWMYPYLEPHGLIFKLNRQPLAQLPDEIIRQDYDYWSKTVSPLIGNWLKDDTSVSDVAAFNEKVFLQQDFSGFTGDTNFALNSYAQKMFSKDRSAGAGMYVWRARNTTDPGEKERMNQAADFAFRQSWALCPYSPEAVFRYIEFLMARHRTADALLVTETAAKFRGTDEGVTQEQIKALATQLKRYSDLYNFSADQLKAMQDEARLDPSDYKNIFLLVANYRETQQTNRYTQLLLQTISQPDVPVDVLRGVANFFAQTGDFPSLEISLKKLVAASPDVPEPAYDLARLDALLGKKDEAIKNLQTAIELSDQRLTTNLSALDIREAARAEKQFNSIRNEPVFQKLVVPQ